MEEQSNAQSSASQQDPFEIPSNYTLDDIIDDLNYEDPFESTSNFTLDDIIDDLNYVDPFESPSNFTLDDIIDDLNYVDPFESPSNFTLDDIIDDLNYVDPFESPSNFTLDDLIDDLNYVDPFESPIGDLIDDLNYVDPFEIPSNFTGNLQKVKSRFASLDHIDFGPVSRSDWTDDRLLNLKGIVLRRYNPTQLAPIVKEGLASLQGTVSHRTIGAIMVSAWNLYSLLDRKYVFPEIPINTTPDDEEFTALSQSPSSTNSNPNGGAEIQWPVDDSVTCAVGAYVCACLLRLATKPTSNFLKAWGNIKNRYSDLNKRRFTIRGLNPIEENLKTVRMAFTNWSEFKNTLSRFLYHFNELRGNVKGLARFAFEQHLSLTGLHSYNLFRRVADKLEANPDDLSAELNSGRTQRGLEMINTILQNFEGSNDEKQRRQTWRYARLFDAQMFAHLQTKKCRELTSILAMTLKEMVEDQDGDVGDVSQIVQIQNLPKEQRDYHQRVASNIIQHFASKTTRTA